MALQDWVLEPERRVLPRDEKSSAIMRTGMCKVQPSAPTHSSAARFTFTLELLIFIPKEIKGEIFHNILIYDVLVLQESFLRNFTTVGEGNKLRHACILMVYYKPVLFSRTTNMLQNVLDCCES